MVSVFLINGIALWILGAAVAVQALSPTRILTRTVSIFLISFALLNGTFVLVQMFQLLELSGLKNGTPVQLDKLAVFLLPLSFMSLFGFGAELLISQNRWSKMVRAVYVLIPLDISSSFFLQGGFQGWLQANTWVPGVEYYTRLLVVLPGCFAAAWALWRFGQSFSATTRRRLGKILKISALALVGYGAASSVIKFSTPEVVNSLADSNHPEHMVATLLSVGIIRTVFAVSMTLLLSYAFLIAGRKARLEKPAMDSNRPLR